jgi:glyoxylase I family protein
MPVLVAEIRQNSGIRRPEFGYKTWRTNYEMGIQSRYTARYEAFQAPSRINQEWLRTMTPPSLTMIDHVSVIITSVERSRRFYRDILGLREIAKPKTFDFIVAWFDLGGGQTLHLLLKGTPDSISPRHFCLRVTDAKAARAYFQHHVVPIVETTIIPGADRFFIHDPDGNRIELMQWLQPYDPLLSGAAELDRDPDAISHVGRIPG